MSAHVAFLRQKQEKDKQVFQEAIGDACFPLKQLRLAKIVQEYMFYSQTGTLDVKDGQLYDTAIMLSRLSLNCHANLIPQAKTMPQLYRLRSMGNYAAMRLLSSYMWSQYFNYNGFPPGDDMPGVFHQVYKTLKHSPTPASDTQTFAEQCVVWGSDKYRRFGRFYAYKQEVDGCVIISKDMKEAYKVLGLSQSVEQMLQAGGGLSFPVLMEFTLLPFKGIISHDGVTPIIAPASKISAGVKKKLKKAYAKFVKNDAIITQLVVSKEDQAEFDKQLKIVGVELSRSARHRKKSTSGTKRTASLSDKASNELYKLRKARKSKAVFWVFRRWGYTARDNPENMCAIMSLSGKGQMFHMFRTKALEPTVDELLIEMGKAVRMAGGECPRGIGVDFKPTADRLAELLMPEGIICTFYPPPSKEELAANNMF